MLPNMRMNLRTITKVNKVMTMKAMTMPIQAKMKPTLLTLPYPKTIHPCQWHKQNRKTNHSLNQYHNLNYSPSSQLWQPQTTQKETCQTILRYLKQGKIQIAWSFIKQIYLCNQNLSKTCGYPDKQQHPLCRQPEAHHTCLTWLRMCQKCYKDFSYYRISKNDSSHNEAQQQ